MSGQDAAPVLVTGVGQRAGLHLARSFLDRGTPLIGTFRTERPGLEELRRAGAELIRCDFYDDTQLRGLVAGVQARTPFLRAIIHNASEWLPDGQGQAALDVFSRMMRVHAGAPFLLNHELAPLLKACTAEHTDIIHIGDYVSDRGSRKHVAYAASKAAQDNLTRSFAARLAPKVKVNSIAPALLLFNEGDDEDYRNRALSKSLLRKEGGLEELRHAVDYLMDSGYVTGRVLHLDGGRHLA